jgi:predicted DNA-binding transcriptional regulator AlpA
MNWVLINKLSDLTGLSEQAIYAYIKKGIWCREVHYRKALNGRLFFNLKAIEQWIEGKAA